MGVRRGEQRTTPLTITAAGTALFFPALAALVAAAVALDALDLATTALVLATAALTTASRRANNGVPPLDS